MPYFIILPLFVLAVVGLSAATVVVACVPRLRPTLPIVWRVLLWSSLGVVLANIPVFGLYFVPLLLERTHMTPAEGSGMSYLKYGLVAGLLVGPFIASAAGFVGGSYVGVSLARRKIGKRPNNGVQRTGTAPL